MKKLIYLSFALLMLLSACTKKQYTVWIASPWQQVIRSTPPGDLMEVNLKAAANEYEPFRIIIHNGGDSQMEDVNVQVTDLKSEQSTVISSDNFELFRAYYLNVTKPSNRTENPVGWYPDALIPFKGGQSGQIEGPEFFAAPFSVDTAQNAEVWCDLYVPAGTASGIYKGTVTVTSGNKRISRLPVTLTVWDFELPAKISMRSHFGSFNATSSKMMGAEKGSERFLKLESLYGKELLRHRAMPSAPENVWPEWNETDGIIDNGESQRMKELVENGKVTALDMPLRYYREDKEKCKSYLTAMAEWLRNMGFLDLAYIYLEDEPNDADEYEIVRQQGALIKAADPDIKRMCTEQTITSNPEWGDLYGAVDIWCPLWGLWNEPTARERLEQGEELWSYTALCQGAEGTPWWQIDTDPLNFRSPFWLSWRYDISGYLYWSSTYWGPYETLKGVWEAPYFRKNFWGEGMLLYPGQPAGIEGFVPSIRLKLYREAMEDYEYMVMAAAATKGGEVYNIVSSCVTDFQKWSREKGDYDAAREKLAELIVR
ncbi:MAG: DUF4091 domain-containing protein [Prolixibacteraceae bacterium]|nr:DUF4091 domain-containing protein [Prolixibacteraceae bacterium]